jgi:capsular polysaccharide biosynthesis protein
VKRAHRFATRRVGGVTRRTTARAGRPGGLPWRGTAASDETVALEPGSATLHLGGPAQAVRRPVPHGTPESHPFFELRTAFTAPRRHVLDLTDGLVVGDYGAHVTSGGILDYETSDYYGVSGWREHPIYLRWRMPEVRDLDGSLLSLATRGTGANYYHFMMDLLPRWGVFREALPDLVPDRVLLNRSTSYQRQLLALVGLADVPSVEPARNLAYRAERLLVPGLPNYDTLAPPWTTQWLRLNLPAERLEGRPSRIYVTRGQVRHTRRLVNEAEIRPILDRHGFTVIDPGTLSVQEQIDHFAAADVVVAPHGAGLTNLTFCRPGVKVLELFAPRYLNCCFWAIASNVPGATYHYLVGETTRAVDPAGPMLGVQDDITVSPKAFETALRRLLDAEPG